MNRLQLRFKILSSRFMGPLIIAIGYPHYSSFKSSRWDGISFDDEIKRCIQIYRKQHTCNNKVRRFFLKVDIIWCYYRYKATPDEYFLFDFSHCNHKKRATYLTTKHKDDVMRERVGMGKNWELLENKYIFYQHFKDFFKRDVLLLNLQTSLSSFAEFHSRHPVFILKPIGGQCGVGVIKIEGNTNSEVLYKKLQLEYQQCLLEEVIEQDPEMAALNMSSVNTVRLPTFINKSGFHVLKPYLRMGRNGCVVDNTHGGGIFCGLDAKTGIIRTEGMDREGNLFSVHPDNNHSLIGWQVPRWGELIAFAQNVHETIPYYPYVGWDFALTKNGWVLIEGNWGQFCAEYIDKEGIKEQFDAMFD